MRAGCQNVSGPTYRCAIDHRAAHDAEQGVHLVANSPETWTSNGSATAMRSA